DFDRRVGADHGPLRAVPRTPPHLLAGKDRALNPQVKINFNNTGRVFGPDEDFVALEKLNLQVYDGEFVTVVGPSGCGKSTAMNIAAGLLKPTSGECLVDGKVVEGP